MMSKRDVAVRILNPKVVTNFLSSQTRRSYFMNNRCSFCRTCYIQGWITISSKSQTTAVCGERLKMKQTVSYDYDCKTLTDNLQIAFVITTSTNDISIHPERFCICCKHSKQRAICALTEEIHHRCSIMSFQWQRHTNEECKVHTNIHFLKIAAGIT